MAYTVHLSVLIVVILATLCYSKTTVSTETTTSVADMCQSLDKDCETCVKNSKCLWCHKNMPNAKTKCIPYPVGDLIPRSNTCPLSEARWGVCWLNYEALLISMGVIAGVIVLSISCCCIYCCCCRNRAKRQQRFAAEDERVEREREEREARNADRRKERQSKYDDIRRKYGLTKDDGYKRFDNE